MRKKKLPTDKHTLFLLTQALLDLEREDIIPSFSSANHRAAIMELRVNLGGRLFMARMKDPVPEWVKISTIEAEILHFAARLCPSISDKDSTKLLRILHPFIV